MKITTGERIIEKQMKEYKLVEVITARYKVVHSALLYLWVASS